MEDRTQIGRKHGGEKKNGETAKVFFVLRAVKDRATLLNEDGIKH